MQRVKPFEWKSRRIEPHPQQQENSQAVLHRRIVPEDVDEYGDLEQASSIA